MALAAKLACRPTRFFVLHGDGELDEGSVWEAMLSASKHHLNNLGLIIDRNQLQGGSATEEALPLENLSDKLRAFGFRVLEANGHDVDEVRNALSSPADHCKPSAYIFHTVKGKGIRSIENDNSWHSKNSLPTELYQQLSHEIDTYQ